MPSASLEALAQLTSGTVVGDAHVSVELALPLQDASVPCITLADSASHLEQIRNSAATAVVVREEIEGCPIPMLVVDNLHDSFIQIIKHLRPEREVESRGIHPTATIHASARIGCNVFVGAHATIGAGVTIADGCSIHASVTIQEDCIIGENTTLHPGVTLYQGCRIGNAVIVHAGATLGADGFGYKQIDGKHVRRAQLGWVEIEDDVEIGAGTSIDRGTYGATRIGCGTKIDNLVQIGHNCQIGKHNLVCAQVGIAGSSSTGDYVIMAGQVGIADHVHLADKSIASAQSGIMQNVESGDIVFGSPAGPIKRKMQEAALVGRLPDMRRDVRALKKQVEQLSQQLAALQPSDGAQRDAA
ncbi:MAG: UDP-3-O-(3-hydroxymyristoyl)glucosamine N-acyltransferase [Aureliella sp.]